MSNRDWLIKSINAIGRRNKSGIVLQPIQPKPRTPSKPKKNVPNVHPPSLLDADKMWQINWMEQFAQSREEARSINQKQLMEIEDLKTKVAKQNDMLIRLSKCLDKKNMRIKKYKTECAKTLQPVRIDATTNTEILPPVRVDAATNTEIWPPVRVEAARNPQTLQPKYLKVEKVNPTTLKQADMKLAKQKFRCPDCNLDFGKKDTLLVHRTEFCINPPIKDRKCKFCDKVFTRRALRVHLNQYVTSKHKPSGKHKHIPLADHMAYLDEIKSEL